MFIIHNTAQPFVLWTVPYYIHLPAGKLEMEKNFPIILEGTMRTPFVRALKWAPHFICLGCLFMASHSPDLIQTGHKRELTCQPRHINWVLISKLSMSLFSWQPQKSLRKVFFQFDFPSWTVQCASYITIFQENGMTTHTGFAPGRLQGLDLRSSLHLGGLPNYDDDVKRQVGVSQGFVGKEFLGNHF